MEFVQIYVLFMVCLVAKGDSKVIECYVCDDCDVLNDCLLKSCPLDITTPPPNTPTPPPTLPPYSTSSISSSSIMSTPPTGSTPTITTTTRKPTESVSTSEAPTESLPETTNSSATSEDITITTEPETEQTEEEPTTQESTLTSHQLFTPLTPSAVIVVDSKVSYHCYSIDIVDNNKWKKRRGCVEVPESKSACEVLRKQYGCSSKSCKVCTEDGCNSSGGLRYSLRALMIALVIELYFK